MARWWLAAALIVIAESSANACRCEVIEDPVELRKLAQFVMGTGAVALVEVEVLTEHTPFQGEDLRVVKTLAGTAPKQFRVARLGPLDSCTTFFRNTGGRATLVLFDPPALKLGAQTYVISDPCGLVLLQQPAYRNEVIRLLNARRRKTQPN